MALNEGLQLKVCCEESSQLACRQLVLDSKYLACWVKAPPPYVGEDDIVQVSVEQDMPDAGLVKLEVDHSWARFIDFKDVKRLCTLGVKLLIEDTLHPSVPDERPDSLISRRTLADGCADGGRLCQDVELAETVLAVFGLDGVHAVPMKESKTSVGVVQAVQEGSEYFRLSLYVKEKNQVG